MAGYCYRARANRGSFRTLPHAMQLTIINAQEELINLFGADLNGCAMLVAHGRPIELEGSIRECLGGSFGMQCYT